MKIALSKLSVCLSVTVVLIVCGAV